MSKKYNVAVIGYGWAATAHIAAINATTARAGHRRLVFAPAGFRGAERARTARRSRASRDLAAMLAEPGHSRRGYHQLSEPARGAVHRRGEERAKHIIVEKPLAIEWSDILAMKQAADETGVKVCVCFECRWSSQFLATKAVHRRRGLSARCTTARSITTTASGRGMGSIAGTRRRELGGSALLTAGCHALDALLLCMGGEVEEVTSYATQSANPIFAAYEYPTSCDHAPALQGRRDRQVRGGRRLLPALLLPHASRRQRRLDPRQQISLARSSAA